MAENEREEAAPVREAAPEVIGVENTLGRSGSDAQSKGNSAPPNGGAQAAAAMHALIPCSDRAHATFTPASLDKPMDSDGKVAVDYRTVYAPVTDELWERHIKGTYPLVVAPVCDDGTAAVSAVDDDDTGANLISIVEKIKGTGYPLYAHRTKSGGARIVAFHDRPIAADEALEVARGIARRLGYGDVDRPGIVEFFPKPRNPDPDKLPKQLNMPYCGGRFGFIQPGSQGRGGDAD
jgi:hypothetical protein